MSERRKLAGVGALAAVNLALTFWLPAPLTLSAAAVALLALPLVAKTDRRRWAALGVMGAAAVALPLLGEGPLLVSIILASLLLGVPLFALIGMVTVACFLLFAEDKDSVDDLKNLVERIRDLADSENLLAVPLFMLSGAIMARGEISSRLIGFSEAVIGWIPGGLGVSAVVACMLFAAISGSSPATVVAIGAMMAPTLVEHGYHERFSHGLLTSSGSLGILIPPSIPMILYPLIYQDPDHPIETSRLFASGIGPGLVIGGILGGFCVYRGVRDGASRQRFSWRRLGASVVDGFWSLLFPILILGGIYTGFFTVVEASAVSVVYALVVELWVHRALRTEQVPALVQETGVILGSLLVIMVAALSFSEFLHLEQVPDAAVRWIESMELSQIAFLALINVLLLAVGTLMDILSAMFLFIPLLAPIASELGVDPMHFGIIFIVNLEIGYLTPPVGLNLFVASTLFERPLGHMIRSVAPFIVLMLVGLLLITYVEPLSVGLGDWIMGEDEPPARDLTPSPEPLPDEPGEGPDPGRVPSLEEMMREAEEGERSEAEGAAAAGAGDGRVLSLDEMMQMAEEQEADAESEEPDGDRDPEALTPDERADPGRVMTLEEMMEAAEEP